MESLKDMLSDPESLARGLRKNGESHTCYKMYTHMERALIILLSGHLYLSNGFSWNDRNDEKVMQEKDVYGLCLSCSTKENVAMWMLYSGDKGKNGAMVNFYRSVMLELLSSEHIELGCFDGNRKFQVVRKLSKAKGDYEIFLTDIIYTDFCKNGVVKLTVNEDHETADQAVLDHSDIFPKNYAWSYEKECRLIVRLSDKAEKWAEKEKRPFVRLTMSAQSLKKMNEDRIVRSPIYKGRAEYGALSALTGSVNWEL